MHALQGTTPLNYAAEEGYLPVVQLLLSHGCDMAIQNNQVRPDVLQP